MKIKDLASFGLMLAMALFLSSAVANADSSDSDSDSDSGSSTGCTGWDCFPNDPPSSSPVPEPTGIMAFAAGALTIGWALRRRSR